MLKQGVKTISAEFIRIRALSQLSFIQFRPYATSFQRLVLSLTSNFFSLQCQKVKRFWRRVWTLSLRSRPPLTQGWRVLFRMWIIWKIGAVILIKRKYGRKRRLPRTHVSFSGQLFFFLYGLFTPFMAAFKALSKQSKQFLLFFYFLV